MMAFKILNHQVILEPNMLPKIRYQRPERNCKGIKVGTSNQLFEPQARLDTAETTFFYSTKKIMEFNCNHKTSRLQKCWCIQETFKKRWMTTADNAASKFVYVILSTYLVKIGVMSC